MSKYFGTDGIRDLVNNKLTSEFAYKVGKATYVLGYKTIYVGYDTRESSQTLAFSLIAGLLATGNTVYNLNMVSTPCVAYYSFINKLKICFS